MQPMRAALAECLGTFWLVLGGCGAAVFAAGFGAETNNNLGLGFLGVSLAFGLSVVTGAYAFGHVSGGHFNPAVTAGLAVAGRFEPAKIPAYVVAQIVGGILAATVIFTIASGAQGFAIDGSAAGAFATNGYGALSPGGYSMVSALLAEIVLTAVFLIVILGATSKGSAAGMGGLAIGLCLTLIHMVSIPITNTSVNPARSTAMAVFVGGDQVGQLWLFWVAPLVGAALGGGIHRFFLDADDS